MARIGLPSSVGFCFNWRSVLFNRTSQLTDGYVGPPPSPCSSCEGCFPVSLCSVPPSSSSPSRLSLTGFSLPVGVPVLFFFQLFPLLSHTFSTFLWSSGLRLDSLLAGKWHLTCHPNLVVFGLVDKLTWVCPWVCLGFF